MLSLFFIYVQLKILMRSLILPFLFVSIFPLFSAVPSFQVLNVSEKLNNSSIDLIAINQDGAIIFNFTENRISRSGIWMNRDTSSFIKLELGPGEVSSVSGINSSNRMVGIVVTADGTTFASSWDEFGSISLMDTPDSVQNVQPKSINDNGVVVGECKVNGLTGTQIFSLVNNDFKIIKGLNGFNRVSDVNSRGEYTGSSSPEFFTPSEITYGEIGETSTLETLSLRGRGNSLSDSGTIVGKVVTDSAPRGLAFIKRINQPLEILGTLGDGVESEAFSVNSDGVVVGTSLANIDIGVSAIYYKDGILYNIEDMLFSNLGNQAVNAPRLHEAVDINDRGEVLVNGGSAFLLIPDDSPNHAKVTNASCLIKNSQTDGLAYIGWGRSSDQPIEGLGRAIGPTLNSYGVENSAQSTRLILHSNGVWQSSSGGDWATNDDVEEVERIGSTLGAFRIPRESKDSAIILPPTRNTGVLGFGASTAETVSVLGEIYFNYEKPLTKGIENCSILAASSSGSVKIGVVVEGESPMWYLVRLANESLEGFGVKNNIGEVSLRYFDPNAEFPVTAKLVNRSTLESLVGAFPVTENEARRSMVVRLSAGLHFFEALTDNTGGQVLIELYEL